MLIFAIKSDAFKTFYFPNIDNTDYQIYLDKDIFNLRKSIYLSFEIINRCWSIVATKDYEIVHHKKTVESILIKGRELFNIKTVDGEIIKGLTLDNETELAPYDKYDISRINEISVGKDAENDIIYDFKNLVSKKHCDIARTNRSFEIRDFSANGVFVNHRRISGIKKLAFGDIIDIFGLQLLYLGNILAVKSITGEFRVSASLRNPPAEKIDASLLHTKRKEVYFNRAPRIFLPLSYEEISIEPPTALNRAKKRSVFLTIGPSFTMAIPMLLGVGLMIFSSQLSGNGTSPFMYMGLITAIGSAILGAMWALLNLREANKQELMEESQRFNLYGNYLIEMSDYIKSLYVQNYESLHRMYPSAADCCKYNQQSKQLWTRNKSHTDFLFFRLGLGNIAFQVKIKAPSEKFSMVSDSLKSKPMMLYENFKVLYGVPVGVDVSSEHLFGIAGGKNKAGVYDIVNDLIVQIAASISYTDAKIVFCFDGSDPLERKKYEYIKWLPHVWSKDRSMRYFASDRQEISDVFFEISNIIRQRSELSGNMYEKQTIIPHYFLFVSDISMLDGELIGKYVFDRANDYGLTTFIMTDSYHKLPNSCETIIQNDSDFKGVLNALRNTVDKLEIDFDKVSDNELLAFSKALSKINVKEAEDDTEIVGSLTFLEMYGVSRIEELGVTDLWRKNRTFTSMRALIGKKSGGADCYLDIHEKHHGPHGLVAGTTGSGKSETIQTFILSLAINFSPEDVAFFIIDFKGGGMANLFSGLPHLAGQISNLSGNQIRRAMVSIKSENIRRQKIFGEYGVNNINHYTQLYKRGKSNIPIPHLLIIIDEFAELKKEEPDFMRELISVAQVGRSLGIHLILATQKPAGTVDDNIWSNAKFRICLRVQDRQDSNDMLHNPDAAFITQAGRGYLQVGNNELYEQFQSGFSGAVYDRNDDSEKDAIATMITSTGKTALVGNHTRIKLKEQEKRRWYGFLYDKIVQMREEKYSGAVADFDTRMAVELIRRAQIKGYNIGSENAEIESIRNFISAVPSGNMPTEEAVSYIILFAEQTKLKMPEYKEKTQLEAVVAYLSEIAKKEGCELKTKLWMPLLRKSIDLYNLLNHSENYENGLWKTFDKVDYTAIIGEYDDPQNQTQLPFSVNFSEGGHFAVCGTVVSGKSTLLQTLVFSLAMKYSPDRAVFYILDYSGGMLNALASLPHLGGIVTENETDKASKFFNLLEKIVEERKTLLNGGSFLQYIKSSEKPLPAIFIVIDNFAGFKEKTDNAFEEILIRISREGVAYGIFLALSSAGFGMSEIQNRIGDNIKTVVSLEMGDRFKYMDVLRTTRLEIMPEAGIKGRGIGYVDGRVLEFQTAVAIEADDVYKRNDAVAKICEKMNDSWKGALPRRIPGIPENPTLGVMQSNDGYQAELNKPSLIPFAYRHEDASIYSIDLSMTYCYVISGRSRTGKTNVLKTILSALLKKQGQKIIVEQSSAELKSAVDSQAVKYYSTDKEIFDCFNALTPVFIERNQYKKTLLEQGLTDEEVYSRMQRFEPVFILIADFGDFLNSVYHPSDSIQNMSGFFENIFEKGYLHNVYFFTCINTDNTSSVLGLKAYTLFTSYKTGVHLGGNLSAQRIFNFSNIHFSLMSKQMKKGEGLVPNREDDTVAEKIIIPYSGGQHL